MERIHYMKECHAVSTAAAILAVVVVLIACTACSANTGEANLLPNGGFETDSNGDGVPGGWLANPGSFSRETLESVRSYIKGFNTVGSLLAGETIKSADGHVLAKREPGKDWGPDYRSEKTFRRYLSEYLPQNSRFGILPLPAGLDLGNLTLELGNHPPYEQVVSEPIAVKANTGYRLSYWFRAYDQMTIMMQIIDGSAPRNETWPKDGVVSGISLGWAYVPYWTRYEIPFRTGANQTSIRIRPWMYFSEADTRRVWYDDFRLVEDNSVVSGEIGTPSSPEPKWPADAVVRGFVVASRPTLPLTYSNYFPSLDEVDKPVTISVAPGQIASRVLFVRALTDLKGPVLVGMRGSPQGMKLVGSQGLSLYAGVGGQVSFRVIHPIKLSPNFGQWEMRPHYLMPGPYTKPVGQKYPSHNQCWDVQVPSGEGRCVLMTVDVPAGTPPGDYAGEVQFVAPGKDYVGYADSPGPNAGYSVPLIVKVRDVELLDPDVTYGMYVQTGRMSWVAPQSSLPYYEDLLRHGMNSVDKGGGEVKEYKDSKGAKRLDFSNFDLQMKQMAAAGTWRNFLYYPYGAAQSYDVQMAIRKRCRDHGWPEPIFYVGDEPSAGGSEWAQYVQKNYGKARTKGLRTVTSGPDIYTQGDAYNIWIEGMAGVGTKGWNEAKAHATKLSAEIWAYYCNGNDNTHPRNIRFHTGLWTWATGIKGNWIWEYANSRTAFSLSDSVPPENWHALGFAFSIPSGWGSVMAWEARREGVDDYRYLHTMEGAISDAVKAKKGSALAVRAARRFLADLRSRIPLDVFDERKHPMTAQKQFQELAPGIGAEEYDRIQDECAKHIMAIKSTLK